MPCLVCALIRGRVHAHDVHLTLSKRQEWSGDTATDCNTLFKRAGKFSLWKLRSASDIYDYVLTTCSLHAEIQKHLGNYQEIDLLDIFISVTSSCLLVIE